LNFVSIKEISSNGSRRSSCGNISVQDLSDLKQELEDFEATFEEATNVKSVKTNARKRKAPAVEESGKDLATRMNVSETFVEDYGPQLKYSFSIWKKNSKVLERASVDDESTENPIEWNVYNVCSFISKIIDDKKVIAKFREQEVDGAALIAMCQEDLMGLMNIKMGTAIKIYNRIMYLREEVLLRFMQL
jgi:hypothetical protein